MLKCAADTLAHTHTLASDQGAKSLAPLGFADFGNKSFFEKNSVLGARGGAGL